MWKFTLLNMLLLPITIPACGPKNRRIPLFELTQSDEERYHDEDNNRNKNEFFEWDLPRGRIRDHYKYELTSPLTFPKICPPQDTQSNKELVTTFFQRTIGDKNTDNLEFFLSDDYIQHNPTVADGIEGFREFIRNGPLRNDPKVQIDFKRVSAEGDLVWLHSRVPIGTMYFAVIDIFRIECGKIAEHWDVLQEITPDTLRNSRNRRPFF